MHNNDKITRVIENYIDTYQKNKEPIRVNFRELVPSINKADRYTHLIHSYPAKLLCHIPYFFLQTDYFCPQGGLVLDPFCGTGTVLLEAKLANKNSIGADANPLARLITTVKVSHIDGCVLSSTLDLVINKAKSGSCVRKSTLENVNYWFHPITIDKLASIAGAIEELPKGIEKDFFNVCFSNLIKKVSYADPRISVPVRLKADKPSLNQQMQQKISEKIASLSSIDVYNKFKEICDDNIKRIVTLNGIYPNIYSTVVSSDARNITKSIGSKDKLKDGSVDLILTSPPYAGAQKYIRSSSLNLGWLGLANSEELRSLDKKNIGRENYRKSELGKLTTDIIPVDKFLDILYVKGKYERAHIVGTYINEMKVAIDESIRVLKDNGYYVIVIGNNVVCGLDFNTQEYLTDYIKSKGLSLKLKLIDDIKSYGLMTKRNKTASRISCEWVLVFQK